MKMKLNKQVAPDRKSRGSLNVQKGLGKRNDPHKCETRRKGTKNETQKAEDERRRNTKMSSNVLSKQNKTNKQKEQLK